MSPDEEAESTLQEQKEAEETPPSPREEALPGAPAERPAEEQVLGEEVGVLTIPLGCVWEGSRFARTERTVRLLRKAAVRYLKPEDEDSLRVSEELNRVLWSRGRTRPPRRVRVRVFKDEEGVYTLRPVEAR
ncbi:MAG: hypothetical protein QW057_03180 [Candidatus Bathyarchaeia archaeon]